MNHTFDEYLDISGIDNTSLKHYGRKDQKWYQHTFGNWERHARYANGRPNPDSEEATTYGDAYGTGLLLGSSAYLAGLVLYNKLTETKREKENNTKLFGPKYKKVIRESAESINKKLEEMGIRTIADAENADKETVKKIDDEFHKAIDDAIRNNYDSEEARKYITDNNTYGSVDPYFIAGIAAGLGGGLAITAYAKYEEKSAINAMDKKRFGPKYKECKKESQRLYDEYKENYAKEHGISMNELESKKRTEYEEPLFWMAYAADIAAKKNVYGDEGAKKYAGFDLTKSNSNTKADITDAKKYGLYGSAASIKDVKLNESITDKLHDMYEAALDKLNINIKKKALEVDPNIGLKVKTKDYTKEEDMKAVNPRFLTGSPDYTRNCMYCATAYELRRRGYDVEANKIDCQGFDISAVNRWFPKAKSEKLANLNELTGDTAFGKLKSTVTHFFNNQNPVIAPTIKELKKQGDGARGMLFVTFEDSWGGHCIFYDVQDNKVTLRDPQSNVTYQSPEDFLRACDDVRSVRLDNLEIDKDGIKEAVH